MNKPRKKAGVNPPAVTVKQTVKLKFELKYLSEKQAAQLLKMFDSPESFAENFSALKTVSRGLYKIIEENNVHLDDPLARMFKTVNDLQAWLYPDDIHEAERILQESGMVPNTWRF